MVVELICTGVIGLVIGCWLGSRCRTTQCDFDQWRAGYAAGFSNACLMDIVPRFIGEDDENEAEPAITADSAHIRS